MSSSTSHGHRHRHQAHRPTPAPAHPKSLASLTISYRLSRLFSLIKAILQRTLTKLPQRQSFQTPMSSPSNSDTVQPYEETERRQKFWRSLLLMLLVGLLCAFLVAQTEWYVSLPGPPGGVEQMRRRMEADWEAQRLIGDRYREEKRKEPVRGLVFDSLFGKANLLRLERAKQSLLSDRIFEAEFKRKYGVSLQDVNALVISDLHISNPDNKMRFGFMELGWRECRKINGSLNVGGYTVRDTVVRQMTEDGTPRIILSLKAFSSDAKLRQVLFHEMLHALNVPGHHPSRFNFKRSDLVYLPEYREFLERAKLRNDESWFWYLVIYPLSIITLALFLTALFNAPWQGVRSFPARLGRKA